MRPHYIQIALLQESERWIKIFEIFFLPGTEDTYITKWNKKLTQENYCSRPYKESLNGKAELDLK